MKPTFMECSVATCMTPTHDYINPAINLNLVQSFYKKDKVTSRPVPNIYGISFVLGNHREDWLYLNRMLRDKDYDRIMKLFGTQDTEKVYDSIVDDLTMLFVKKLLESTNEVVSVEYTPRTKTSPASFEVYFQEDKPDLSNKLAEVEMKIYDVYPNLIFDLHYNIAKK